MKKLKQDSRVNKQLKFFRKRGFHSSYSKVKPRVRVVAKTGDVNGGNCTGGNNYSACDGFGIGRDSWSYSGSGAGSAQLAGLVAASSSALAQAQAEAQAEAANQQIRNQQQFLGSRQLLTLSPPAHQQPFVLFSQPNT